MISQYQARISQAVSQIQSKLDQGAQTAVTSPDQVAALEQMVADLKQENSNLVATLETLKSERQQEAQELETLYAKLADALNDTPQAEDE